MACTFYFIATRAKSAFENLKKNYTKKRSNVRNSKRSGTSREAVEKAENELRQWSFLTWLDDFVQPRVSKSSFDVDTQSYSQQTVDEHHNTFENDEENDFMGHDESNDVEIPEDNTGLYPERIVTSKRQKGVNISKPKQPIIKRKLSATKENELDRQKLSFLKSVNERMESRDKNKKVDDAEDRFASTIADDLRQLPHRQRLLAKNEIKNTLFRYQMEILDKSNNNFNDQSANRYQYQLPTPFSSSHGNSFPIQQPQNQNHTNVRSPENHFLSPVQSPSYPPVHYGNETNTNFE